MHVHCHNKHPSSRDHYDVNCYCISRILYYIYISMVETHFSQSNCVSAKESDFVLYEFTLCTRLIVTTTFVLPFVLVHWFFLVFMKHYFWLSKKDNLECLFPRDYRQIENFNYTGFSSHSHFCTLFTFPVSIKQLVTYDEKTLILRKYLDSLDICKVWVLLMYLQV